MNQLITLEINLDDKVQALLLLSSLLDSWKTLVMNVSNLALNGKLTLEMVNDSMFNEEKDEKSQHTSDDNNSAVVSSDEEIKSLMCTHSNYNHVGDPLTEYIVNIGVAYYCVPKRELFTIYKEGNLGVGKIGNTSVLQIVGISDIVV
ncbi:hypothetical protein RJ641_001523 [Dillenia turbinata]|uniref:Uncharacterized protein n=1 Tax=Dillenia turbinata TaxID=194707 RepID=A0AAN8VE84_9MAGN